MSFFTCCHFYESFQWALLIYFYFYLPNAKLWSKRTSLSVLKSSHESRLCYSIHSEHFTRHLVVWLNRLYFRRFCHFHSLESKKDTQPNIPFSRNLNGSEAKGDLPLQATFAHLSFHSTAQKVNSSIEWICLCCFSVTLWNRLPFFPPRDGRSVPRGHEKSQLSTYVPVIAHAFHSNEEEDQNLPYHHWSMDLPHCNDNRCIRFDGRHG